MKKQLLLSLFVLLVGTVAANAGVFHINTDLLDFSNASDEMELTEVLPALIEGTGYTIPDEARILYKSEEPEFYPGNGFSVEPIFDAETGGATSANVYWNLTNGSEIYYILLKDGKVDNPDYVEESDAPKHLMLYSLWGVDDLQRTEGSGTVYFVGYDKQISHISFIGVPEPSLVLLLGFGLGAVSLISRRFKKN